MSDKQKYSIKKLRLEIELENAIAKRWLAIGSVVFVTLIIAIWVTR
jgi:hypothetical protein